MTRCLVPLLLLAALAAQEGAPAPTPTPEPAPPAEARAPAPFLGVRLDPVADFGAAPALMVSTLTPGGTFAALGVQVGDVLTQVAGKPVTSLDEFRAVIAGLQEGSPIAVSVRRAGAELALSGTVASVPRPRVVLEQAETLRGEVAAIKDAQDRQQFKQSLAELLTLLNQVEKDLPRLAEEFKRLYPEGRFEIKVHIDISSDTRAATPKAVEPAKTP